MTRRIAWTLTALLSVPTFASAEILHFREGGHVALPVSREGDDLRLDTPMGILRFPQSDFARIEPGGTFEKTWAAMREEALKAGPDDRRDAALWALGHGLVVEAESMLRTARADAPGHDGLKRLSQTLDRLQTETPDPPIGAFRKNLPEGMREARSPHAVLIHNLPEAEAKERVDLIETIIKAFYLDFASLGFDLPEPRQKLVSILFARERDYQQWLRDEGATGFLNTRGYHHPTRGAVVAYDCRSDALRVESAEALRRRREELASLADRIAAMPPSSRMKIALPGQAPRVMGRKEAESFRASLGRQIDRQEMMLELTRREIDLGVAAHETIHQLVATTRLAPTNDRFPNWLHEGLAMQFETIRGGRWAGLSQPSNLRLAEFRKIAPPPNLERTLLPTSLGAGYDREGYAASWAVVFYLRQKRTDGFVAILDSLRAPRLTSETQPRQVAETLQQSLRTPLSEEQTRWLETMKELTIP